MLGIHGKKYGSRATLERNNRNILEQIGTVLSKKSNKTAGQEQKSVKKLYSTLKIDTFKVMLLFFHLASLDKIKLAHVKSPFLDIEITIGKIKGMTNTVVIEFCGMLGFLDPVVAGLLVFIAPSLFCMVGLDVASVVINKQQVSNICSILLQ